MREIPIPEVKTAPKTKPKHLKLTSLWKCTDVAKPGNILVVPQFGGCRGWRWCDAWTAVAEIGLNGRLLASHKLDLQKEESIWYLRTAVGATASGCSPPSPTRSSGAPAGRQVERAHQLPGRRLGKPP